MITVRHFNDLLRPAAENPADCTYFDGNRDVLTRNSLRYSRAFVLVHHAAVRLPHILPQVTSSGQQPFTRIASWRQHTDKKASVRLKKGNTALLFHFACELLGPAASIVALSIHPVL